MSNTTKNSKNASIVYFEGAFENILSQYDIPLPPRVITSARVTRWGRKSDGGKPCFAVAFEIGGGYCFGDWSRDLKICALPRREYTKEERRQINVEMKKADEKAEKARKEKLLFSTQLAAKILDASTPVTSEGHAYLTLKKVKSFGLREITINRLKTEIGFDVRKKYGKDFWEDEDSLLVVPLNGEDGTVQSLQFINSGGIKKYLSGGVGSGYFPIGSPPSADGYILLCEGYATGAALHESTGHYTVCSMGTSGLKPAAKAVRGKYPEVKIIICADDDSHKHKDNPNKINPGLDKAREAGNAVRAYVVHPVFNDVSDKPSDFNDLHCRETRIMDYAIAVSSDIDGLRVFNGAVENGY